MYIYLAIYIPLKPYLKLKAKPWLLCDHESYTCTSYTQSQGEVEAVC